MAGKGALAVTPGWRITARVHAVIAGPAGGGVRGGATARMSETARPPLLAMRGIRKSFGNVAVLKGVDFATRAGEIHALMGENGAGKSTLMKIAGGIYPDYEGEIAIDGVPVQFQGTRDATRHGVAVIHQELNLVPGMTVADNIFLGSEMVRGPFFVDRRRQLQAAAELLEPLNFRASPATLVGSLRVGEQQLVEIAKALSLHTRILIMDEPTSALSVSEALRLHEIIRRLAGEGVAVVYISHRMEEIFELCHAVTVLRDGALVGTVPISQTSRSGLIRMMAGRDVQEFFHRGEPGATDGAESRGRRARCCRCAACGWPTRGRRRCARDWSTGSIWTWPRARWWVSPG